MRQTALLPVLAPVLALVAATAPSLASAQTSGETLTRSLTGVIKPVNPSLSGQSPSGSVTLTPRDGEVIIELSAEGLSPGMHLAHLHGFAEASPEAARCPDAQADANGDGVVDLMETRPTSGVTLVPFTDQPASLKIKTDAYPEAGQDGRLTYRQTVDLKALDSAMQDALQTPAALEHRVVYIHGVPEGTKLPGSVQSLDGVPAHVTLPIACAELQAP